MFKELTLILSKPRKQGVTDTVQRSEWRQRQGTGEFFWKEGFKTVFSPSPPTKKKIKGEDSLIFPLDQFYIDIFSSLVVFSSPYYGTMVSLLSGILCSPWENCFLSLYGRVSFSSLVKFCFLVLEIVFSCLWKLFSTVMIDDNRSIQMACYSCNIPNPYKNCNVTLYD